MIKVLGKDGKFRSIFKERPFGVVLFFLKCFHKKECSFIPLGSRIDLSFLSFFSFVVLLFFQLKC